jgi:chromosomal replication initiator protein
MSDNFPFEHFLNFNNNNNLTSSNPNLTKNETKPNQDFLFNSFGASTKKQLLNNDTFGVEELQSITSELINILKENIMPQKFSAFFQNTFTVASLGENTIEFAVTTNFIKNMMENHYLEEIQSAVATLLGKNYNINLNVMNSNGTNYGTEKINPYYTKDSYINEAIATNDQLLPPKKVVSVKEMTFKIEPEYTIAEREVQKEITSIELRHNNKMFGKIDKTKTFDNFIVGHSNNMAHAFSLAVSKDPGNIYPQLYLYGNSGLGKTHLLHAICNYIQDKQPEKRICMISAGDFTKEMVLAIQSKKIEDFQRKYTDLIDVLIIDDIHELKDRERTQKEFFHIFNELQEKKKQLVFTSDKPPQEISGIEERIITRLSSALVTDIQQPDLETRCAILRKKANEKDIYISDEVINLIASSVKTNIRELEGKLIRLGAYSDIMNVDIDLEIAREQLGLTVDQEEKLMTIETIAKAVANHFKLPLGDIRGKARKQELVFARHISMYMTYNILKKTLEEIGAFFDNRDHSTVIHAIDKIKQKVKEDNKVSQIIYEIESKL